MRPPAQVRERLFQITTRPRPLHGRAGIVVPRSPEPIPPEQLFTSPESRHILELGAGWGEFCAEWTMVHPDDEYVAFEIKGDRIRRLLRHLERRGISRVKIIPINFSWFLEEILPPRSFDLIIINFPDPWPKKRHWKHRLIDAEFPDRMLSILRPGGRIYAATDYGPYARKVLCAFRNSARYRAVYPWPGTRRERPADFPTTRFEQIHLANGLRPYYQLWESDGNYDEKNRQTGPE